MIRETPSSEISPEEIVEQLARILSSDQFIHSGILSQFLKYVVETTMHGHGEELKEYTIARKVWTRKVDFNPQMDSIVRIHAGRLRRALHDYYQQSGKEDPVIISMKKGGYVPDFSRPGTSGHIGAEKKSADQKSYQRITVAVLPFKHLGTDTVAGPFADALGDHISTELTRYAELSVISYYSCRNIAPALADIREAGRQLGARYILTGAVQGNGSQLRIMTQLTDAENNQQVWANTYDKIYSGAGLFHIQDEITWAVVSQTTGSYGAISRHLSTMNPTASGNEWLSYNAISWYYQFVNNISENLFYQAEAALSEAVKLTPDYAMAWAVLGEVYVAGTFMGYRSRLAEDQLPVAIDHANTAIRIDRTCQHAYQTLALANLFMGNESGALKAIEAWSAIKPAAAGIEGGMGFCLICCGEYDRGYQMIDSSIKLNPYYQWWLNGGIAFYYYKKEMYRDAIYWIERMNMPTVPWQLLLKSSALFALDMVNDACDTAVQMYRQFPFMKHVMPQYAGAFLQDEELVNRILEEQRKFASAANRSE